MIQDIAPFKFDNRYIHNSEPDENSIFFCFHGNKVLASYSSYSLFPLAKQLISPSEITYLFTVGDERYFLISDYSSAPEDFEFIDIKKLRRDKYEMKHRIFALYTAYHLYKWYSSSKFCGECGGKTVHCTGERAVLCTNCGELIYPRINPAIIAAVTNGEKLLITKYVPSRGVTNYALVAGYMEIGETPEDTLRREVMEEVGLKVKNIRYYKSQPWGFSAGLLIGFFCDVDGDTEITLDKSELSLAEWVDRRNIIGQTDDLSLTNEMMLKFRDGQNP